MKLASSILALATLAVILPAEAQPQPRKQGTAPLVPDEAVSSPFKVIYRVSGVTDNGSAPALVNASSGVATSFHCSNFSGIDEKLKFVIRAAEPTTTKIIVIPAGKTITASTHGTVVFNDDLFLSPGVVIQQGAAIISATSAQTIFCSAMILDANNPVPVGIALHMVRFNPANGTQE